jgi:FlaA1/EpsC-like NDP-sugar epimerase
MEENVVEAITNNILGTNNVVVASADGNVQTFVLISTDKAVRPTSVMGCTKRVAEQVVPDFHVPPPPPPADEAERRISGEQRRLRLA